MRPERMAAAVAAFASVLLAVPALAVDEPTSTTVTLDDVSLRWGVNNETSNRAFAPNTYNFMSAGQVPDPGHGGSTIREGDWSAASGNVRIEKWDGTAWQPATWAGLSTDSAGNPLGSPTSGTFSGHTFVISGGAGTVDPTSGTAHIAWDGDLSVVYYSGMSFFYLSDPVLDVADGVGALTATIGGYASSVDDPTIWAPISPRTVTVADLPGVDLSVESGFSVTPAYRGVRATGVPQRTDGPDAGSFPQSWIDTMDDLGTAAFWYSSGASTDAFKVPLPVTIGYDAAVPVDVPTPTAAPTKKPIENPVRDAPTPSATVTQTVTSAPAPTASAAPAAPAVAPPLARVPAADAPVVIPPRPVTELALVAAPDADPAGDAAPSSLPWWLGSGCLLAAALLLLLPVGGSRPGARTTQQ